MMHKRPYWFQAAVFSVVLGIGGCLEVASDKEFTCDDDLDNDEDNLADCADSDCSTTAASCQEAAFCTDGEDNDVDGDIDCDDADCAQNVACLPEAACADNQDNDGDGDVDCADTDCANFLDCVAENCFDGVDNNGDGLFDCLDPACDANCADACTDAPSVDVSIQQPVVIDANNIGHDNDNAGSCQDFLGSGPEVVFAVTSRSAGRLAAIVSSAVDLSLYARDTCNNASSEIACAEVAGAGQDELLVFDIQNNQTVFLFVDGLTVFDSFFFDLQIFIITENDCTNLADDDLDGDIDCLDAECATQCIPGNGATGTACDAANDCDTASGNDPHCLTQGDIGFPGGSCSEFCDINLQDCAGDAICLDLGVIGPIGVCVDGCNVNSDCRSGYSCQGGVCFPDCTADNQCPGDFCNNDTGFCSPVNEDCDNDFDDDGDNLTDCNDTDCNGVATCNNETNNCDDGLDNDNDGDSDCGDSQCTNDPVCTDILTACNASSTITIANGQGSATGDTSNGSTLFQGSCTGFDFGFGVNNPEKLFEITAPATGQLDITLSSATDQGIYVRANCGDPDSELGCADFAFGGADENLSVGLTNGQTVTLFVDGFTENDPGPFTLTLNFITAVCGDGILTAPEQCDDGNIANNDGCSSVCTFEPEGDCSDGIDNEGDGLVDCNDTLDCGNDLACDPVAICSSAPSITLNNNTATASGDTGDGVGDTGNAFAGSCAFLGLSEGPENLLLLTVPVSGFLTVDLDAAGSTLDGILYIRTDCEDDGSEIACADVGATGDPESVSADVTANEALAIFVDGFAGTAGPYTLTINLAVITGNEVGLCADNFDNDQDGLTDCADLVDCGNDPICGEQCDNENDDDADGNFDCSDTDCANINASCLGVVVESEPNNDAANADIGADGDNFVGDINPGGDSDFIEIDLTAGDTLSLTTANSDGLAPCVVDTTITIFNTNGTTQLAFDDDSGDGACSLLNFTAPSTGTFFISVEAFSAIAVFGYRLLIDVVPAGQEICNNAADDDGDGDIDCGDSDCAAVSSCAEIANACAAASDITANVFDDNTTIETGDTTGGQNIFDVAGCFGSSGPEDIFSVTATVGGVLNIDVVGPTLDAVLYVRSDCETEGSELACADDGFFAGDPEALAGVPIGPGETRFIFVDGFAGSAGAYTLTVSFNGGENCTNNADDDGDGAADCADSDCATQGNCPAVISECASATIAFEGNGNNGDFSIADDNFVGSCNSAAAGIGDPEDIFVFTAAAAGDIIFSAATFNVNDVMDLYIRTTCEDPSTEVVCIDEFDNSVTTTVTANAAGDQFFAFTEDRFVGGSTYTLTILPVGPEICDDTFDNDNDGLVDCADSDCALAANCAGIVVETEPNGSAATADLLPPNNAYAADITSGDEDFVAIAMVAGQSLLAVIRQLDGTNCINSGIDSELTLFDTDGVTELANRDDISGIEFCSVINAFVAPATGIYFLRVHASPFNPGAAFQYQLQVSVFNAICGDGNIQFPEECELGDLGCDATCNSATLFFETEPNDDTANAEGLAAGLSVPLTAFGSGVANFDNFVFSDDDFYAINLPSAGSLTVSTRGANDSDCSGTLFDSALDVLSTNGITSLGTSDDISSTNFCSTVTIAIPSAGVFFVDVRIFGDSASYYVDVSFQ